MNTKHLISFVTFAQEKSMLKTSMKLHYAESTLSEHIASLERELGAKLLESGPRGSRLTEAGKYFLPRAEALLEQWRDLQREMLQRSGVYSLNIISAESLALNLLPPVYDEFLRKYHDISLSIANGRPERFIQQLKNHEFDVAFGYYWGTVADDGIQCTRICEDKLVFFAAPNHRLIGREQVKLQDFAHERLLFTKKDSTYYKEAQRIFKKEGVPMNTDFFIDSAELIKRHVAGSRAIGLLARSAVQKEFDSGSLVPLELEDMTASIDVVAVTLEKKGKEPVIQELFQIARKITQKQLKLL